MREDVLVQSDCSCRGRGWRFRFHHNSALQEAHVTQRSVASVASIRVIIETNTMSIKLLLICTDRCDSLAYIAQVARNHEPVTADDHIDQDGENCKCEGKARSKHGHKHKRIDALHNAI